MKFIFILFFASIAFVGCSKKSGEDYLKSADENLKNNKAQEAISDYENFVKEYPKDEKAPEALNKTCFNLSKQNG